MRYERPLVGGLPIRAICAAFDLGEPSAPPTPAVGGMSHRVWRLATARGTFAVKELNRNADDPLYVATHERAFQIEVAAFDAGIPMPRPIPLHGSERGIAELPAEGGPPITVRVHDWIDGATVAAIGVDQARATGAGALVARLHALRMEPRISPVEALPLLGEDGWRAIEASAASAGMTWAARLIGVRREIARLEQIVIAGRDDRSTWLTSHHDTNPANVLVTRDRRLLLIDWDAAGTVCARQEVAATALDWAGAYLGPPAPRIARAVIDGYRRAGGTFENPDNATLGWFICEALNWLAFNVRRTIGERVQDEQQQRIAAGQLRLMLDAIPRFAASAEAWVGMLR